MHSVRTRHSLTSLALATLVAALAGWLLLGTAAEVHAAPENINDELSLAPPGTSYNPAEPRAPRGVYTVTATFTNTGDESQSDVYFIA